MAEPVHLDRLAAGVTQALDVDLGLFDDASLDTLISEVVHQYDRLGVALASVLAEWDERRAWAADGSRSAAHRLARLTRQPLSNCRGQLSRARRMAHVPLARAAVLDGAISAGGLDLLTHAATVERRSLLVSHEAALVDVMRGASYDTAREAVRYWTERADDLLGRSDRGSNDEQHDGANGSPAAGGERRDVTHTSSKVFASSTLDDVVRLDGSLDPVAGAIVMGELRRLTRECHATDRAAGIDRSPAQRRAAALVEMATRSATMPPDGRRPAPLFTVLIGESTFDRLCELDTGAILGPGALTPYLDQALLESVLFDGPSTVISVSSRRTFAGALRRAIQVRDRRCRHSTADCPVRAPDCDVDHVVPYARGGSTSQFNARLECSPHNRDSDLHDHDAQPLPERSVDRLDELRCRLRWRFRHSDDWRGDGDHDGRSP